MGSTARSIVVGKLGPDTPLPAISIRQVSGFEEIPVNTSETKRLKTQRIQVMVHAKTGVQQLALFNGVLAACPDTKGTIGSIHVDSILPAGEGPDLSDAALKTFEQSRDFSVRFHGA